MRAISGRRGLRVLCFQYRLNARGWIVVAGGTNRTNGFGVRSIVGQM